MVSDNLAGPFDVIVVGAGPAGCTAATILAQYGHRVLQLEKESFPRFHIGESLMPLTFWPLRRLGMIEKLRCSDFVRKESVQFVNDLGKTSAPFYFHQTHPHESSTTWQVTRGRFDQMLLENAREKGADAREGWLVHDVLFEDGRAVGVLAGPHGEPPAPIHARVVVDATGNNAMLSRKLKLRCPDPKLRKAAVFAHYAGATRDTGIDEGATIVAHVDQRRGWFWVIPLEYDITSIGVVADIDYLFKGRKGDPAAVLDEEIDRCAGVRPRLVNARRTSQVHVLSDFSWSSTRCAGDGWVLIGDAFGFLDPIYSSGVFLALVSGERAADAIHDALLHDDPSERRLAAWGDEFYRGMQAMRKLVYAFYTDGFSFGEFNRRNPTALKDLVGILIGDVFTDAVNNVFNPMSQMCPLPEPLTLASSAPTTGAAAG
ncbi:MAG: putative thiazole biosynthetic enzyme [Phycisphaerae bacterium]|nr:putative thiazole biosynthetic enzyme [Phycisphaerae bacterium]